MYLTLIATNDRREGWDLSPRPSQVGRGLVYQQEGRVLLQRYAITMWE